MTTKTQVYTGTNTGTKKLLEKQRAAEKEAIGCIARFSAWREILFEEKN